MRQQCVSRAGREERSSSPKGRVISAIPNSCLRRLDSPRNLRNEGFGSSILNRDEIVQEPLADAFHGSRLPMVTADGFGCGFVVSMPKVKTHHWAGVTFSLKNLFGVVPGLAYGWPKNVFHWKGMDRSIWTSMPPFAHLIADGIVGMEGNGPLHGAPRTLGRIVLADDPVAADLRVRD